MFRSEFKLPKNWTSKLARAIARRDQKHREHLNHIADEFMVDPWGLVPLYVEQNVQDVNPANDINHSAISRPVFSYLEDFLNRSSSVNTHLFIFADAGMGKSSLLTMLTLSHAFSFWPKDYHCLPMKLGRNTLDRIRKVEESDCTILLLDALDEDPMALERTNDRILEILKATRRFHSVIISCHTPFLPNTSGDLFMRPNRIRFGRFNCPTVFLSMFDKQQAHSYLEKRFSQSWVDKIKSRSNSKLLRAKDLISKMGGLAGNPSLLSYIEDFLETSSEHQNEYRVFEILIELRLERAFLSSNDERRLDLWHAATEIAVHLHTQKKRELVPEELIHLDRVYLHDFQTLCRSLLVRTSEGSYRFSHQSILEFLIVRKFMTTPNLVLFQIMFSPTDQMKHFINAFLQIKEPADATKLYLKAVEGLKIVPWGEALLSCLVESDAPLTHFTVYEKGRYLLQLRMEDNLRTEFGTAPEVLVLAVADEIKGSDLNRADQELRNRKFDLDPDLLLVIDDKPDLPKRLDNLFQLWGQWIPWQPIADNFPSMENTFRSHLPGYDIYEKRDPVRGRQVVGRIQTVAQLTAHLKNGRSVGVFGLRKIGKTTLVRAAADRLDPVGALLSEESQDVATASMAMVWLDLERVYDRSLDGLVTRLLKLLTARLNLEQFTWEDPTGDTPMSRLEALLMQALNEVPIPICIVLDEYDLLFEGAQGQPAMAGVETLFRMFRALAQETGKLAITVIGRDPHFLDQPLMNGHTNPMLGWCVSFRLGPLSQDDSQELLGRLGRRIRLLCGSETHQLAYQWTGGHPLLHRQFGSALFTRAQTSFNEQNQVETDPFCESIPEEFPRRDAVTTLCREVAMLLESRYEDAHLLFSALCESPLRDMERVMEGVSQETLEVLQNFGLILTRENKRFIPEVFRWYYVHVANRSRRRPA